MKELEEANVILGIKITITEKKISLDQSQYIEKILKKQNYFENKPVYTPHEFSVKLLKNTDDNVNQSKYAGIVRSLRHVSIRPDIAYVIGLLCRFTSRPSLEHWNALERVMKYFKQTKNLGLHYQKFPIVLEGYNDVDWNSLLDDSKATSVAIFLVQQELLPGNPRNIQLQPSQRWSLR